MLVCALSIIRAANLTTVTTSEWVKYLPTRKPETRMRGSVWGKPLTLARTSYFAILDRTLGGGGATIPGSFTP